MGEDFLILDASEKVGQTWSNRWDSLQLFSPPSVNKMPGWSFPSSKGGPDTKDEMAEYLAAYALKFDLPIKCGIKVNLVSKEGSGFSINTTEGNLTAERIIIATGAHQFPYIPTFAAGLSLGKRLLPANPAILSPADCHRFLKNWIGGYCSIF